MRRFDWRRQPLDARHIPRGEWTRPAHRRQRRLALEALEARCLLTGGVDWGGADDAAREPAAAQVAFRLVATDAEGVPVAQVLPGSELWLEVYVQDVRAGVAEPGVFAAYLDVDFSDELLAVIPSDSNPLGFDIEFGSSYTNGRWASASAAGRIAEAGAYQFGAVPLGAEELLLFRARLAAGSMTLQNDVFAGILEDSQDVVLDVLANDLFVTGTAQFVSGPAGITPAHDVITFAPPVVVPAAEIDYGATAVEVTTVGGHPITAVTQPSGGGYVRIAPNGEYLLYTPSPDFFGTESFIYTVADGQSAAVIVQVDPVNDPPQVHDHLFRLGRNETLAVDAARGLLSGAWDPEGDPLEAAVVDGPLFGELTWRTDGSFDYQPEADFVGTDRFTFVALDPGQASAPAEVLLEVGGPRVDLWLEVTDEAGASPGPVVAGQAAWVQLWARDLRDDFYPDRGVFAAYVDLLFDGDALEPVFDDQLPLGFAVEFAAEFANDVSGVAGPSGAVRDLGASSSATAPAGAGGQRLLTLPLVARELRGADDTYLVSRGSSLNLLDVLTNDRSLVWSTTVSTAAAQDFPAHEVLLWTPRSAVPSAEVVYGDASVGRANPPGLKVLAVGPTSHGGQVTVESDGEYVGYRPAAGFVGTETFHYVLADPEGRTATAEVAVEVVPSWQNLHSPLDVNSDSFIAPIDALLIITYLNAGHPSRLEGTPDGPPFWDVNGDGYVAPIDALLVINYLNRRGGSGGGEGESSGMASELVAGAGAPAPPAAGLPVGRAVRAGRSAAPAASAPSEFNFGLLDPDPAARSPRRLGREEPVPRREPPELEELCELLAAGRGGEPHGG